MKKVVVEIMVSDSSEAGLITSVHEFYDNHELQLEHCHVASHPATIEDLQKTFEVGDEVTAVIGGEEELVKISGFLPEILTVAVTAERGEVFVGVEAVVAGDELI